MGLRKDIITNPYLSEYVYDVAINLTNEQRKRLDFKHLKALKNSRTTKAFATSSTIEEKAIFLGKVGIEFGWYLNLTKQKLNDIYEKHSGEKMSLINTMLVDKLMVISNREMMQFLGLMASNCHSDLWMMNREFFNAGHRAAAFKKSFANPTNTAVKETVQFAKENAKFAMDSSMAFDFCVEDFGLTKNSMYILIYLFVKSSYHVEEEQIKNQFRGLTTVDKIGKAIFKLQETKNIEKSSDSSVRRRKFIITGIGRDTVLKFQKKIFNLSNF